MRDADAKPSKSRARADVNCSMKTGLQAPMTWWKSQATTTMTWVENMIINW